MAGYLQRAHEKRNQRKQRDHNGAMAFLLMENTRIVVEPNRFTHYGNILNIYQHLKVDCIVAVILEEQRGQANESLAFMTKVLLLKIV